MRPLASALLALLLVAAPAARAADGAPSVLQEGAITVQPGKEAPEAQPVEDQEAAVLRDDVEILCGGSNSRVQLNDTGASLPSYACSVAQTNLALYRLRDKAGFVPGSQRFYLQASTFTRGIGAVILGWLGVN